MFSWCCCCREDSARLEENLKGGQHSPQIDLDDPGEMDDAESSTHSRMTFLTPQEKEMEKERLQKLVKTFAKEAVNGLKLTLVHPDSGSTIHSVMQLGRQLSWISLDPSPSGQKQNYAMTDVTSVYKGRAVSRRCPTMAPRIADTSVGVEILYGQDVIFFNFPNTYERDRFYTCLKILRMSLEIRNSKDKAN